MITLLVVFVVALVSLGFHFHDTTNRLHNRIEALELAMEEVTGRSRATTLARSMFPESK